MASLGDQEQHSDLGYFWVRTEECRVAQAVRNIKAGLERNGHGGKHSDATIEKVHISGTHKTCTRCGCIRKLEAFTTNRGRKSGTAPYCRKCRVDIQLQTLYGITLEAYDALWDQQRGRCAICRMKVAKRGKGKDRGYVDHCHDTGRVRGLLCMSCNFAIGLMKDDPKILRKAAKYVGS